MLSKSNFLVDNEKKIEFLNNIKDRYADATYELYEKLIVTLDEYENYKGVSSMNMTRKDFLELLISLNSTSLNVLYTYRSAINNYLIYLTDIKNFKIGIMELDKITKEDLEDCINSRAEERQFITEKEYYDILDGTGDYKDLKFTGNYQDKLVIILLWNQIKGLKNYSEIINLKKEDVNLINRTIQLEDRIVQLTEKEIDIVTKAMKESCYIKTIQSDNHILKQSLVDYVEGVYLVKSTAGSKNYKVATNQIPYATLANRMTKYFNLVLKKSELTGLKIYKSSVYNRMLLEYRKKLTYSEIIEYSKKNNVRLSLSNYYREQDIMYNKLKEQGLL